MARGSFGRFEKIAALSAVLLAVALAAVGAAARPDSALPVASAVRIAGDDTHTRFSLDLDRSVALRAFSLDAPDRAVIDLPQMAFDLPAEIGASGRGLIKSFRYGMVMPGGSRIVLDLARPARIEKAYVEGSTAGEPDRLIVDLQADPTPGPTTSSPAATVTAAITPPDTPSPPKSSDSRPVVVIDAGHGGVDNGTQAGGEMEKNLVLDFALALRDRIEKAGKFRVVMTRADDTFIALGERVQIARAVNAQLFLSIHADALPRREGDAQGATIYTLSEKASDVEAERLAELENKSDAIGGINLTEEPTEVADILIDLAQRETRTFSKRFARTLMTEMKSSVRMHKHPLKSAGFKVLKAPDVPSVLIELGYVSNKGDLQQLVSQAWRTKAVTAVNQAVEAFFAKRTMQAGTPD